jgi:hypothetical protein
VSPTGALVCLLIVVFLALLIQEVSRWWMRKL